MEYLHPFSTYVKTYAFACKYAEKNPDSVEYCIGTKYYPSKIQRNYSLLKKINSLNLILCCILLYKIANKFCSMVYSWHISSNFTGKQIQIFSNKKTAELPIFCVFPTYFNIFIIPIHVLIYFLQSAITLSPFFVIIKPPFPCTEIPIFKFQLT